MAKTKQTKKVKKKVVKPLPKKIRDELILSCALKGYSSLAIGKSIRLKDQYKIMSKFYHGRHPDNPSQIKLLCDASYTYRRLFETTTTMATRKSDNPSSISSQTLKRKITRDNNRTYKNGIDINSLDLEKKFKSNPQLVSGRQLYDTAKRGLKSYKKALSFASRKWNLKTDQPKESGTTEDDALQYVREQMYKLEKKTC